MDTLQVIVDELSRQAEQPEDHNFYSFEKHQIEGNWYVDGVVRIRELAAAVDKAREELDFKTTEVLEALMERVKEDVAAKLTGAGGREFINDWLMKRFPNEAAAATAMRGRVPGLPIDTSATAIGYSANGRPWALGWNKSMPKDGCWFAVGVNDAGEPQVNILRDENADFIVEHEIVIAR